MPFNTWPQTVNCRPLATMKPGIAQPCNSSKEISIVDPFIKPPETDRPVTLNRAYPSDLNIAVQSALAAAWCLGLPAGLLFWLVIAQRLAPSTPINDLLNFFRDNAS